ncbi:hypothetical protein MBLNU230_g8124t1 [Neophaeotheca triangularis]
MNLPPPTFDLDAWLANYEGGLLLFRLAHVAMNCPSLSQQSMSLAVKTGKNGKDTQLYLQLCELAGKLGMPDLARPDHAWAEKQEELNKRELSRLEGELRGYKNNLIRESIRMGQDDLATHLLAIGGPPKQPPQPVADNDDPQQQQQQQQQQDNAPKGYSAAYQAYARMRDHCTTPSHIASMTLRLIYTSLLQTVSAQLLGSASAPHANAVLLNTSRLRGVGVKAEEQARLDPISFAMDGIGRLALGDYRAAAKSFLQTPPEYSTLGLAAGTDFTRAVAPGNDIAIYGGLTALATMSREDLNTLVLGGSFRAFLELEPHMRKAISLFTTAKYQACLSLLRHYYSDWGLDVFLGANTQHGGSHVDRLFAAIREKSITAYFSSFSEVSLDSLASTFPPSSSSPTAMEEECLKMIEAGKLEARLDVVKGVLVAPQSNSRQNMHAKAKDTADEVERTLLLRLHKVNMTLAGLEIPKVETQKWGQSGVRAGNGY